MDGEGYSSTREGMGYGDRVTPVVQNYTPSVQNYGTPYTLDNFGNQLAQSQLNALQSTKRKEEKERLDKDAKLEEYERNEREVKGKEREGLVRDNAALKNEVNELKEKLEEIHRKEKEEEEREDIREEFQDNIDDLQNRYNALNQQREDYEKQQNAHFEMENIIQEQNKLQQSKVEQASERCEKAKADLSKLINELTNTESNVNAQNDSMSLFKKFLIAIGLSNEPEKLIKLREKVSEINKKIKKQEEKITKSQNILTEEEEALLKMVEDNIEKINKFKKKSIEEKEEEINRQMEIQKAIRSNRDIQEKEKNFLIKQATLNAQNKIDLVEKVRLDRLNQNYIDEEIRKRNLVRNQQRTAEIKNKAPKYSKETINKAKTKGPIAAFY